MKTTTMRCQAEATTCNGDMPTSTKSKQTNKQTLVTILVVMRDAIDVMMTVMPVMRDVTDERMTVMPVMCGITDLIMQSTRRTSSWPVSATARSRYPLHTASCCHKPRHLPAIRASTLCHSRFSARSSRIHALRFAHPHLPFALLHSLFAYPRSAIRVSTLCCSRIHTLPFAYPHLQCAYRPDTVRSHPCFPWRHHTLSQYRTSRMHRVGGYAISSTGHKI
eukprot:1190167-Rhodomonas_salina.2